jgi:DNA-binding MarR family transcriptional regulator
MWSTNLRDIDELVFEIFRINTRLIEAGDATVGRIGLTSAKWRVLGAIVISAGPVPVAQVARTMGLTRQAVQRVVNELADSKLVEFSDNPSDKRARTVALTAEGTRAYEEALILWRTQWTSAMEEVMTHSEIVETTARLRRLRGLLQAGDPSAE